MSKKDIVITIIYLAVSAVIAILVGIDVKVMLGIVIIYMVLESL